MISASGAVRDRVLWTELAIMAAFCGFLFFFGAGAIGLAGADEPRYAQIAREMLARHDWITPVLGGQSWLEKPVLYYWEAMIAYSVFGVSDWAARMPSAFSATAMVAAIYFFMRNILRGDEERSRFWRASGNTAAADSPAGPSPADSNVTSGVPLDAALITASAAAVVGFAHGASMDMLLAANFTIGMLTWFAWLRSGRRLFLTGFYFFMALGMLAKGPVAPGLAVIIISTFAFLRSKPKGEVHALRTYARELLPHIRRSTLGTLWLPGIAIFLAVALPWYIAVEASTHQFFRVFFLEHNLERFSTNLYRHPQPFWYYLPVLLLSLMPWTAYGVAALVRAVKPRAAANAPAGEPRIDDLTLFLIIWAVVPPVFFSISQAKLPGYILPAIPAWTMLLALEIRRWNLELQERKAAPNPRLLLAHSLLSAGLTYAVIAAPYVLLHVPQPRVSQALAAVTAVTVFLAVWLTVRRQGLRSLRFVTLVPLVLAFGFLVRVAGPALDATQSARPVARAIAEVGVEAAAPVAVFNVPRSVEYGLHFYRNQPIAHYEVQGLLLAPDHLIVARQGSVDQLRMMIANRRIVRVGSFVPQGLEFFWVTSAPHAMSH